MPPPHDSTDITATARFECAPGTPAPERFRPQSPTDPSSDPDVATFIVRNIFERRQRVEPSSTSDSSEQFPPGHDSLAARVARQNLLSSQGSEAIDERTALRFPEVGAEVFGFRLRLELGRGAFARVFLAEQTSLAGRPVAVKISGIEGREPQTLAQMQHTHIVPIHSVQDDERVGLRAVCMPYFGGASLSCVLEALGRGGRTPQRGRELVAALQKCSPPAWPLGAAVPAGPAATAAPLNVLNSSDYIHAVVWLVARLAEGLQHAHERGILHRDIKPSNILVGADGQPMLLDFNLSQSHESGSPVAVLGGTIAYMSPEHLRALLEKNERLPCRVDHRSDIYSLGMVLFEMLAGARPFEQSGSYSALPLRLEAMATERSKSTPVLRERRHDAPWSLESIVRKCLAPEPGERYQHAEQLAEDLRAFSADRPLRFAPELSRVERVQKWSRRNPRLTSAAIVALAASLLLTVAGVAVANLQGHLAGTRAELGSVQARDRLRDHRNGTAKALCLVNTTLDSPDHVRQGVAACEQTLAIYGSLDGPAWREPAEWLALAAEERARLREDTRELLMLLAVARARLAPADPAALRLALALLERAETIGDLAPSRAVWLDRSRYLAALGEQAPAQAAAKRAEQIPVVSARDHYLNATALGRTGTAAGYRQAIAELDETLASDPRHYWSWLHRGVCNSGLGEYVLAAGDFGHCAGLWPEFAWGHFNQGYVFDRCGKKVEAIACYTRALECDPALAVGHLNRGLARLERKQWPEALADFDRALALGRSEPAIHAGRGVSLEGLSRSAEADEAFRSAFNPADASPPIRLRIQLAYGFAVAARLPKVAGETFREVLRTDPQNAQALYGLAMIAMREGKNSEAIRMFTQAVEASPEFVDARRYRAVALAREGSLPQAVDDINWCLEKDPQSGESLYAAGCVAALANRRTPDLKLATQAIDLLEKAFARGVGRDKASTDPDLDGLKSHAKYRQLLAGYANRSAP